MLQRPAEPVSLARGLAVAEDLVATMRALPRCVGLAAPQVGEPVRVAVVDVAGHPAAAARHGLLVLVNPTIVQAVGREVAREGCQSLPQFAVDVARARRILVASDLHPELWSAGFEARAIQHEIDHLSGLLILDRAATARAIHRRPAVASLEAQTSPAAGRRSP